ncbi:MAG: aldo/keto reductase [Planctomycetes bacterium]|nr:aldo/keto reductase [Planctomycetota bacterium]
MRQVLLGNTGLTVSAVGFGGIPIGRLTDEQAVEVVTAAIDAGVTFFDTAYSYPDSEPRIGMALSRVDRERIVVASKDGSTDGPMFGRHVEESLARLGTEYLDLLQFHNMADREKWEAVMAPGGPYEVACRLRDRGVVRHIGVTSHSVELAAEMIDSGCFETVQLPLNFVADEAASLVTHCAELGIGFIGMKPFAGGMIDRADLALRYLQQFPTIVPIPGIETLDELSQVIRLYEEPREPTDDERRRMAELKAEIGKVFCRACGYCQPCPEGISIPMVLRARTLAWRMPEAVAARALSRHMAHVDRCTECRRCVERCPYGLDVPAMLRESREWFDEWRKTV